MTRWAWIAALVALAAVGGRGVAPTTVLAPTVRGFEILSEEEITPPTEAGVRHAETPIYRLDAQGFPLLGPAGYLEILDQGEGFFHASTLPTRAAADAKSGRAREARFGDIEGFVRLRRVIRAFRRTHPEGPRIGIDDISSRFGGFPDFNGDGESDHFSHQMGMNFNLLLPSKTRPETEVHLGRRNEEAYDEQAARDLVALLLENDADTVTTSRGARIFDGDAPFELEHHDLQRLDENTTVVRMKVQKGSVVLLEPITSHGNHLNAWFICNK